MKKATTAKEAAARTSKPAARTAASVTPAGNAARVTKTPANLATRLATQSANASATASATKAPAKAPAKVSTEAPAKRASGTARKKAAPADKALTRERIVAVAIEQIDQNGLTAFSLREVARQLDVYPTAVYWHVPNRDALLAAVVEATMAGVTPEIGKLGWQDWFRELFRRYRKSVQRHPNVAQLVGAQLVSNASLSPLLIDRILAVLLQAGCAETRLVDMYNVVVANMVGFATLEFAPLPTDDLAIWTGQLQEKVHDIRALEYPTLARHLPALANRAFIVRWQSGSEVPLDSSFDTFVEVAIAGMERMLAK
ncbi:TetR/AcrR family transcriptional regulator [Paraburkholderia acidisoli]|uniref:TetR family transcriptional regulator n=1 Tax=Paraburkholderia acidisoli TaxID=2571748 RepID=A0A7Z2GQA1_9BURK|nr:TetR/AcrR family transcriptional regulator [Paraburkholderia acidisoli]QGZ66017.1 TetR family transcriptional regulator [Paraburkholderia acidisoli]